MTRGVLRHIGLRAGNWRFIAQAPGFSPDAGEMPVRMGGPNPPIRFVLKKSGVAVFGALGGITSKDLQNDLAAADALFKQSRWDDAIQAYRNLMEKSTALVVLNLQIGAAYRAKKDYAGALAAYDALLKADPGSEKARVGIAMTNLEKGDAKAAEDALLAPAEGAGAGREVFFQLGEMKHRPIARTRPCRGGIRRRRPPIRRGESRSTNSRWPPCSRATAPARQTDGSGHRR